VSLYVCPPQLLPQFLDSQREILPASRTATGERKEGCPLARPSTPDDEPGAGRAPQNHSSSATAPQSSHRKLTDSNANWNSKTQVAIKKINIDEFGNMSDSQILEMEKEIEVGIFKLRVVREVWKLSSCTASYLC
jgi:hypothetical protein